MLIYKNNDIKSYEMLVLNEIKLYLCIDKHK